MKNKKIIISIILFFGIILLSNICMAADLDVINKYHITVDPKSDGTLNINYHIEWEVLDSDSLGPVSWVEIGIPNSHVDSVKAISSNIKSAKYSSNNGDFVRVDFKKNYYEGEVISFDFIIHQSYMYTLSNDKCIYTFIPGWFDEINVKELKVFWKADDVISSTSNKTNSDGYLEWSGSLSKGKKYETKVTYDINTFDVDTNKQYSNAKKSSSNSFDSAMVKLVIIIVIFCIIMAFCSGGGYGGHGGYGGGYRYRHHGGYHTRSSCACACVSSCACACACAGGGRAGCSKKDFYGTKIKTQKLNKVLNEKIKGDKNEWL